MDMNNACHSIEFPSAEGGGGGGGGGVDSLHYNNIKLYNFEMTLTCSGNYAKLLKLLKCMFCFICNFLNC